MLYIIFTKQKLHNLPHGSDIIWQFLYISLGCCCFIHAQWLFSWHRRNVMPGDKGSSSFGKLRHRSRSGQIQIEQIMKHGCVHLSWYHLVWYHNEQAVMVEFYHIMLRCFIYKCMYIRYMYLITKTTTKTCHYIHLKGALHPVILVFAWHY